MLLALKEGTTRLPNLHSWKPRDVPVGFSTDLTVKYFIEYRTQELVSLPGHVLLTPKQYLTWFFKTICGQHCRSTVLLARKCSAS